MDAQRARRVLETIDPMPNRQPRMSSDDHQILKFRPRTMAHAPGSARNVGAQGDADFPAGDQTLRAQDRAAPDDYRHRMTTNVAAILFTALLTCIGIWLAVKLADLRKAQDCVLMGRRDCAHISSPKD